MHTTAIGHPLLEKPLVLQAHLERSDDIYRWEAIAYLEQEFPAVDWVEASDRFEIVRAGHDELLVDVFGPNLADQSRGDFHVHRTGCSDCDRYRHDDRYTMAAYGWRDVIEDVFGDQIAENDEDPFDYLGEVWFAPCCEKLQHRDEIVIEAISHDGGSYFV